MTRNVKWLFAALTVVLAGCPGSITQPFTIDAPTTLRLGVGATTTFDVTVSGGEGDLTVELTGLPSGVTARSSPTDAGARVELITQTTAPTGVHPLTLLVTRGAERAQQELSLQLIGLRISAAPIVVLAPGGSTTLTPTVEQLGGWSDTVVLSVLNLPTGVTAITTATDITLTAASDASFAPTVVQLVATAGVLRASVDVELSLDTLVVNVPPTLELMPGGTAPLTVELVDADFSAPITVTASGDDLTSTTETATSASVELTVSAAPTATARDVPLTVSITTRGTTRTATTTARITALAWASPLTWSVPRGTMRTLPISITRENQATGDLNVVVSDLPAGVTATVDPITGETGAAVVTVDDTASPGDTAITVTASTPHGTRSFPITLTVSDFAVQAPASFVVVREGTRQLPVTLSRVGFADDVELTFQVAAPFTAPPPATLTAGASSHTATVTAPVGSVPGSAPPLTVIATGGGLTRSATVTLGIGDFTIDAAPFATGHDNAATLLPISINRIAGFDDEIAVTVTALPTGVTATPLVVPGADSDADVPLQSTAAACTQARATVTATAGGVSRTDTSLISIIPTSGPGQRVRLAAATGAPTFAAVEDTCPGLFVPVAVDAGAVEFDVSSASGRYVLLTACNGLQLDYATVAERSGGTFNCGINLFTSHPTFTAQIAGVTPGQSVDVATPVRSRSFTPTGTTLNATPMFSSQPGVTDLAVSQLSTSGFRSEATTVLLARGVAIAGGVATASLASGAAPTADPVPIAWPAGPVIGSSITESLSLGEGEVTLATENTLTNGAWPGRAISRALLNPGEHLVARARVLDSTTSGRGVATYSRVAPFAPITFGGSVGDAGVSLVPGGRYDVLLPAVGELRTARISQPGRFNFTISATPGAVPHGARFTTPDLSMFDAENPPLWASDAGVVEWTVEQIESPGYFTAPIDGRLERTARRSGTITP